MSDHQTFLSSEPTLEMETPTSDRVNGKRVAVIVADGFEQTEFEVPTRRLREAGVQVEVIAPDEAHLAHIEGESQAKPADGTGADIVINEARPQDYDALLIPGGLRSPDAMRASEEHIDFVRSFVQAGKPIAAICHGPWLLADAGALEGKRVTSWPAIRKDIERAGAQWLDEEVVEDGNLITSRKPDDAEAFVTALIQHLAVASRR